MFLGICDSVEACVIRSPNRVLLTVNSGSSSPYTPSRAQLDQSDYLEKSYDQSSEQK